MAYASEAELRLMVRGLLRELLPERKTTGGVEDVRIGSDEDLQAFVAKLAAPGMIEAVRTGKMRFTLLTGSTATPSASSGIVLKGVITERKLSDCGKGSTVILARDAVLTPMAKDLARQLDLKIERNGQ